LDTSVPVEDPRKPKEIEFELGHPEPLNSVFLRRGTYLRGAKVGSLFQTDRKRHLLRITLIGAHSESLVVDYESICAIASERETTSRIPWDLWKYKTLLVNQYVEFWTAGELVGPRELVISYNPCHGSFLVSFDFTPGACRHSKQIGTPWDDASRYAIRRVKLMGTFPEGHKVHWVLSEDNVLAFTVSRQVSFEWGHFVD